MLIGAAYGRQLWLTDANEMNYTLNHNENGMLQYHFAFVFNIWTKNKKTKNVPPIINIFSQSANWNIFIGFR